MRAIKIYMGLDDVEYFIKKSVPPEHLEGTDDCGWVPVKVEMAPDLTIEITAVAAPKY